MSKYIARKLSKLSKEDQLKRLKRQRHKLQRWIEKNVKQTNRSLTKT